MSQHVVGPAAHRSFDLVRLASVLLNRVQSPARVVVASERGHVEFGTALLAIYLHGRGIGARYGLLAPWWLRSSSLCPSYLPRCQLLRGQSLCEDPPEHSSDELADA